MMFQVSTSSPSEVGGPSVDVIGIFEILTKYAGTEDGGRPLEQDAQDQRRSLHADVWGSRDAAHQVP